MQAFNYLKSAVVPVLADHIDTDQIIPAAYLKAVNRDGFGKHLFAEWRYNDQGEPRQDFPLNHPQWKGSILLAGQNFGCGSSREHAVWAIQDYGFKVVLSTSFADIFYANALNNGLLPVKISEEFYTVLCEEIALDPDTKVEIKLETQEVILMISGLREKFDIPAFNKSCILKGQDDLDFLINMRAEISAFDKIVLS